MTTAAIIMMLVAMLAIWGGLALAIVSLMRSDRATASGGMDPGPHRDL